MKAGSREALFSQILCPLSSVVCPVCHCGILATGSYDCSQISIVGGQSSCNGGNVANVEVLPIPLLPITNWSLELDIGHTGNIPLELEDRGQKTEDRG